MPRQKTERAAQKVAQRKVGTVTARICQKAMPCVDMMPTMAAMAADMGEAITPMPAEITEADTARSGRTRAEAATSATTGYTAKATYAVPTSITKSEQTKGPTIVIAFGYLRSIFSASRTRRSRPPEPCSTDVAAITAVMMRSTEVGGEPG